MAKTIKARSGYMVVFRNGQGATSYDADIVRDDSDVLLLCRKGSVAWCTWGEKDYGIVAIKDVMAEIIE